MNPSLGQFFSHRISKAVSGLLLSDDGTAKKLSELDGRIVALNARNAGFSAFLATSSRGVQVLREYEGPVDVHVTGRISDFIAYARASKGGDSIGPGRIEISGDLSTAQSVQAILSELRIDWEEILSRYIGDVGAHQAGRFARSLGLFGRKAAERLEQDLSEYLQIEANLLPTRRDVDRLSRGVFILADDVDRFEARIGRLEQRRRPT
jgi:ubiquinone biosynthesis accessory factor UbiJ